MITPSIGSWPAWLGTMSIRPFGRWSSRVTSGRKYGTKSRLPSV